MAVVTVVALLSLGFTKPHCGEDDVNFGHPGPQPSAGTTSSEHSQAKTLARPLSTFGLDLLLRQAEATSGNVVISPLSIASVLTMLGDGASGNTRAELRRTLATKGLDAAQVDQAWADLITTAQSGDKTTVTVCNSLWLHEGVPFKPAFLDTSRRYFAADCLPLDGDSAAAADQINQWVAERTSGQIVRLFESIDPGTQLVVVNTINLKVGWELFDESPTTPEPFHLGSGASVDVAMMHGATSDQTNQEPLAVDRRGYVAACLKTQSSVDVWIVVPKGGMTPERVVRALRDSRGIPDLYRDARFYDPLTIALPRFEFTYQPGDEHLKHDLEDMGIRQVFSPSADLTGIADMRAPFFVTRIAHEAHIKVDEKGVEAQAASGGQSGCGSAEPEPLHVRADRPFLVLLTERSSGAPLFLAIVRDPR